MIAVVPQVIPSDVQTFENLWKAISQEIYSDSRAPAAARWWFHAGAAAVLEMFEGMSADLHYEGVPDEVIAERLRRLVHQIRSGFVHSLDSEESRRDWGPN